MKHLRIIALGSLFFCPFSARGAVLEVDKGRSRIQVDAKATGHDFTGELKDYTVKAVGDADHNEPASFALAWDFNDLKTGDEKRDKEMISWLGGGKPKGAFKFTKFWVDAAGRTQVQGVLTIHGVAKTVAFPYSVSRSGEWVTIDGKAVLDYQTFKLPLIRAMAVMTVDPALVIRFHMVGKVK